MGDQQRENEAMMLRMADDWVKRGLQVRICFDDQRRVVGVEAVNREAMSKLP